MTTDDEPRSIPTVGRRKSIFGHLLFAWSLVVGVTLAMVAASVFAIADSRDEAQRFERDALPTVTAAAELQSAVDRIANLALQAQNAETMGELRTLRDRVDGQFDDAGREVDRLAGLLPTGQSEALRRLIAEVRLRERTLFDMRSERLEAQAALDQRARALDRYLRPNPNTSSPPTAGLDDRQVRLVAAMLLAPSDLVLRRLEVELAATWIDTESERRVPPDIAAFAAEVPAYRAAVLDLTRRTRALTAQQLSMTTRLQGEVARTAADVRLTLEQSIAAHGALLSRIHLGIGVLGIAALAALWIGWRRLNSTVVDRLTMLGTAVERWRLGARGPAGVGGADELTAVARTAEAFVATIDRQTAQLEAQRRDLAQALSEARAASAAKSNFLATMSHELRTPLNAVIGFSEMMQAGIGGDLTARHREYAADIHASGTHLLNLINDILDFSKMEAGQRRLEERWERIGDLVSSATTIVQALAARRGVRLEIERSDAPDLYCDARAIRQALLNLLTNAIKFSPTDGRVSLRVSAPDPGGSNDLVFEIADAGRGIAPDAMQRLFQPFAQATGDATVAEQEGSGLGLAITKQLIDLHQGRVWLESEPAKGTRAYITLPRARLRWMVDGA